MALVKVVVRLVCPLLNRSLELLAEDNDLLKQENVSVLGSGEERAAGTAGVLPHLERILHEDTGSVTTLFRKRKRKQQILLHSNSAMTTL
jgi:hypothetical protein